MSSADAAYVIVTVATAECQEGLRRLRTSLTRSGWTGPLHVYVPDNRPSFALPDGCVGHSVKAWWREVDGEFANSPTMAKPDAMLDWPDGTMVLYLDGSDVMVFDDPMALFRLLEGSPMAVMGACPTQSKGISVPTVGLHPGSPRQNSLVELLGEHASGMAPNCNAGVVVVRMCELSCMALWWWKTLLGHIPHVGPLRTSDRVPSRRIAGEQTALNIVIRQLRGYGRFLELPQLWNVRAKLGDFSYDSGTHMLSLPGRGRVGIVHCIGAREFPPKLVAAMEEPA